jgi:hypothetical protein
MRMSPTALLLSPVLGACLLLAGCGDKGGAGHAAPAGATPSAAAADEATAEPASGEADIQRRKLTPARIEEIRASGRKGLWADPAEVCAGDNPRGMIGWNVEDAGTDTVVVYLVGKSGSEKVFAQGGPVGEKATGPWLRPDMAFKVRAKDDSRELGTVTVSTKAGCPAPAA